MPLRVQIEAKRLVCFLETRQLRSRRFENPAEAEKTRRSQAKRQPA